MFRTHVHLTEQQHDELDALAVVMGKTRSELIREAIDRMIEQSSAQRRAAVLMRAAGMWKDRDDLPDFHASRAQWRSQSHSGSRQNK